MQLSHELHTEIPLFPLRAVLFSGGRLPLRIFEPRYTDMVSRSLKEDTGFGVVLIREGNEARLVAGTHQPEIFGIGTYARIVDFSARSDGTLGIMVGWPVRVLRGFEARITCSWDPSNTCRKSDRRRSPPSTRRSSKSCGS
jgi:Lon protease-like protein